MGLLLDQSDNLILVNMFMKLIKFLPFAICIFLV